MESVKSAQRVAEILDVVAHHPPGLTYSEVLEATDFPKSSLHSLLATLVREQLLHYTTITKRYGLGSRLFEMASSYVRQIPIVPAAWPFMVHARDHLNETVQLAVLEEATVVYVAKVESTHPFQLVSSVGSRLPAYATGIGQALLATLAPTRVEQLYPDGTLPVFTEATVSTIAGLHEKLDQARIEGYAVDHGEYSADVRCVASPILNAEHQAIGAMSISMPMSRFTQDQRQRTSHALRAATVALSHQLGAADPERWRSLQTSP